MKRTVVILIPVYNDQETLKILIQQLESVFKGLTEKKIIILIINDGSLHAIQPSPSALFSIRILNLHTNIGHQKAITVGLSYIYHNIACESVLVMDGDGEDSPEDALTLFIETDRNPDKVIFAKRKSRQESLLFKFFYFIYRLLFRWLTKKQIAFGNFMIIPRNILDKLVYYNEIWRHLSAGILKTNLPFISIPVNRGKRYSGKSKMSFNSLILHGLGAISVFLEEVASHLLIFSLILIVLSLSLIILIIGIKYFTGLAIPGWASTVLTSMLIILLQGFLLSLFTIFLFLSAQSQRKFIPALHYKDYMSNIETVGDE